MVKVTNESQARYHVVTLLYNGKFEKAEEMLANYSESGIISSANEVFYRFLLEAAKRRFESRLREEAHHNGAALLEHKV